MRHPAAPAASTPDSTAAASASASASAARVADPAPAAAPPKQRGGLGRGLAALIPQASGGGYSGLSRPPAADADRDAATGGSTAAGRLRSIPLRSITRNPNQPRKEFAREELDDLAASIREHGVLQPIVVQPLPSGASPAGAAAYQIVAGERRYRAATAAGLTEIPALIREPASERDTLTLALIENLQRENLTPVETARAYDELLRAHGLTQAQLALAVGKSQPQIANAVRLLNLPAPVLASLQSGAITEGHAKVILGAPDADSMTRLADQVAAGRLTVRDTEQLLARTRASAPGKASKPSGHAKPAPPSAAADLDDAARALALRLGTKVRIAPGRSGRGTIEIDYYDADQLDGLLERLAA